MISGITTIITYLRLQVALASLVGTRIAHKHKFGMGVNAAGVNPRGWTKGQQAIQINEEDDGEPDRAGMYRMNLTARCYGATPLEAEQVARALLQALPPHDGGRQVVATRDGNALLYWLLQAGTPTPSRDPDLDLDMYLVPLKAAVAMTAVP